MDQKLLSALGLGGMVAGGGLLSAGAYNRLGDIGAQAKVDATALAKELQGMTQFQPFTVTSATGGGFGARAGSDGGTDVSMSVSPQEQALQRSLFGGAQGFYGQAMQPTAQREMDIYSRMRAAQRPEEERQRMALEERLFAQGRGGVQTAQYGGTPEQLAMAKAQSESQNMAMLGAMQQAQAEQQQQAALGQQYLGASYVPQSQLLNALQASSLFPQMQQQAQLYGAGQYGETMMSGTEAQLIAEQAQANLMGSLGSGLLSGAFTPVAQKDGGATNLLTSVIDLFS